MKKVCLSLSLIALFVISGCTETTSSESQSTKPVASYDVNAVLNRLQTPLALKGELQLNAIETGNPNNVVTDESLINTYISSDEYYVHEVSKVDQVIYNDTHYSKNEDGVVTQKAIDRHNEVQTYLMVYEDGVTPAMFDDLFYNPLASLGDLDLSYDGQYSITIDSTFTTDEEITFGELVAIMFIGEQFDISTLTITLDENYLPETLSFVSDEMAAQDNSGTTYTMTYTYEAQLTTREDLNIIDVVPYPELEGMEKMEAALQAIQNQNYTVTCYSSAVSETEPTFTAVVTKDGYLVTQSDETYGLISDPNGGVASVVAENGRLKAVEETYADEEITDYLTPGDYNVNLFLPTELGYVLMDAFSELNYLLPDSMFNLLYMYMSTPVIFEVADDLSKITYSYSFSFITEGIITVELTNLGTTVFPYDLETEYDPYFVPTSWEELDASVKTELDTLFGKDFNEVVPFYYPEEGYSYFGVWSGAGNLEISVASDTRAQEILEEFTTLLTENGYTYQGLNENDEESYVNAEGIEVGINYLDFFGSYVIQIYVYPPVA
ncbi:unknown [Firmicutes bacterium CAG:631]|nr:unknown [Firmicutes bacterium CAG:631]